MTPIPKKLKTGLKAQRNFVTLTQVENERVKFVACQVSKGPLTLSQTTNFRLIQTETVCRQQFQI